MRLLSQSGIRRIVCGLAIVLGQAYQLARSRLAGLGSPVLDRILQRDHLHTRAELLERELAIHRAQRSDGEPHKRPIYGPDQRWAILQLMWLRNWSVQMAADRFVLHPNTIRLWLKAAESDSPGRLLGDVAWNRIDDAVRFAVHELRSLFPEPEFGRRTIANHLLRAAIQISPRTVQRVLREDKPRKPKRHSALHPALGAEPRALLSPSRMNQVWHADLTTVRILWLRYAVAAVLDGCTRRLLCLKVFRGTPTSDDMIELVKNASVEYGKPDFLITDHGCQFLKAFHDGIDLLGVRHVRSPVRKPCFNGKVDRFFRTFRLWQRIALSFPPSDGRGGSLDYTAWCIVS